MKMSQFANSKHYQNHKLKELVNLMINEGIWLNSAIETDSKSNIDFLAVKEQLLKIEGIKENETKIERY